MTVAEPPVKKSDSKHDPEEYRMSIGDHLEELRARLMLGVIGFVIAFAVCLCLGNRVTVIFCRPLYKSLWTHHITPQMYYNEVGEPFMVYLNISMICALAIASPWMVYQLWMFIAAGLYPRERKWVTRYLPLSITLLISGMLFVYFLILPWTLDFFIEWGDSYHAPAPQSPLVANHNPLPKVPQLNGDPAIPADGDMWFDQSQHLLKMRIDGRTRVLPFLPESLIAPHITLETYIDMVVMMLLTFGLSFQLPLAVMAIVKIGIVEIETLKKGRRVVYFCLLVLACIITPVVTAMLGLMIPFIFLYELGIWMARPPKEEPAAG